MRKSETRNDHSRCGFLFQFSIQVETATKQVDDLFLVLGRCKAAALLDAGDQALDPVDKEMSVVSHHELPRTQYDVHRACVRIRLDIIEHEAVPGSQSASRQPG